MRCEKCNHAKTYYDGSETVVFCEVGISEDDAYNADTDSWGCKYNKKTIEKKLKVITVN